MYRKPGVVLGMLHLFVALVLLLMGACAGGQPVASTHVPAPGGTQVNPPQAASASELPMDVVVNISELPSNAVLSEWELWDDPASPGGKLAGVANTGEELDPPPENDPNVTFKVPVQGGIPYRCWIHMKVGEPQGVSQANLIWVQFSDAVDHANQPVFKPDTDSFLTAQGPTQPGWTWVGCNLEGTGAGASLVRFPNSGDITVRLQAGMEGVGFDQFLLSPARYLENPPAEPVVK